MVGAPQRLHACVMSPSPLQRLCSMQQSRLCTQLTGRRTSSSSLAWGQVKSHSMHSQTWALTWTLASSRRRTSRREPPGCCLRLLTAAVQAAAEPKRPPEWSCGQLCLQAQIVTCMQDMASCVALVGLHSNADA